MRLTPKSTRDEICGVERLSDGRAVLKARVRAVPQDGEANAALLKVIAKALRVPASAVRLEAGATARLKTVIVCGDETALAAALAEVAGLNGPGTGA